MTAGAWLWCACLLAELGALVAAVRAHRLGRVQLPIVYLLALAFDGDLAIALGRAVLLDDAPRPFVGLARGWYHVETALVLAWPCGLALACVRVFGWGERGWWRGRSVATVAGFWAGGAVALAGLHPLPRGAVAAAILAVELVAVVVAAVAVARGWRRPWGLEHAALVVLVAIELVIVLLGPFAHDLFRDWPILARLPYALGFGAVAAVLLVRPLDTR